MKNITQTPAKRTVDTAPTAAPVAIPRRISKKVASAIDLMVSGECKKIIEAAEKVGLARESLSRVLNKPHIAEHMRTKVVRHLAIGATKIELLGNNMRISKSLPHTHSFR
jgi:hypothetical protein